MYRLASDRLREQKCLNPLEQANILNNLGISLIHIRRYEEASAQFKSALAALEDMGTEDCEALRNKIVENMAWQICMAKE